MLPFCERLGKWLISAGYLCGDGGLLLLPGLSPLPLGGDPDAPPTALVLAFTVAGSTLVLAGFLCCSRLSGKPLSARLLVSIHRQAPVGQLLASYLLIFIIGALLNQ